MNKPFENMAICARKTKRAEVATNELSALDITHLDKETRMPSYGEYTDSESEFKDNWKSIGELARKLAEKAKAGAQ